MFAKIGAYKFGRVVQLVEHWSPKPKVRGSIPFSSAINLNKKNIMKKNYDLDAIVGTLYDLLYNNALSGEWDNTSAYAVYETDGLCVEVFCDADVSYHTEYEYDEYDRHYPYDEADDVSLDVTEILLFDSENNDIEDDELVNKLTDLINNYGNK